MLDAMSAYFELLQCLAGSFFYCDFFNLLSLSFSFSCTTTSNTLPNCLTTIAEIIYWVPIEKGIFFNFFFNQLIHILASCETEL